MTELNNASKHLVTSTVPRSEGAERPSQSHVVEFFRLPKSGGDPHFGLGRSYYYEGEKLGWWRLVRIRQRGKLRGVTLVPYDAVATFIRNQGRAQA
jgi:hypothetical protein